VAAAISALLEPGSAERAEQLRGLDDVRSRLGTPGASARVAAMAAELAR
jgi:hypothetical protein